MLEKEVESKIIAKIAALGLDGMQVLGSWQSVGDGGVKGLEQSETKAVMSVAVGLRGYDSFASPKADLAVAITLKVRSETSPDGAALADYVSPLMSMLNNWQFNVQAVKTDLGVENQFTPAGVRLDGGSVSFDSSNGSWTVVHGLTVRGIVKHQEVQ